MSLYYDAADVLTAPKNVGGSLKSRVFSSKSLQSPPIQVYALVIETCKWSSILKDVIERAGLLTLERKLTPVLSLLLVHDLLLAKKGIALPATHGLRAAVERHKARLQAELTKARIGRKLGSIEALKRHVDLGGEGGKPAMQSHPRWIRINTLKTQLEDQLETTFAAFKLVDLAEIMRQREYRCLYIDKHIPNLVAIPSFIDLTKCEAYLSGAIIFQDKASCFPAYMLDPLPEDCEIIDTCAAPGNKTTHLAAIAALRAPETEDQVQVIHAFEKDRFRTETLRKMVGLAGCVDFTKIHAAQDFLKTDPNAQEYQNVGALLLDPSCSGSGIVGRDEMPALHLPLPNTPSKSKNKAKPDPSPPLKRKRASSSPPPLDLIDDNGTITSVQSSSDLQARLAALSSFQLSLLLHAFSFPAAHKVTYSTCSIHANENEAVIVQALESTVARTRGWRLLRRDEQVRGMKAWPVRGDVEACEPEVAEACVRANKGDEQGTMGFFLAAFVRERHVPKDDRMAEFMRDEKGFIVRDLMSMPVLAFPDEDEEIQKTNEVEEEWNGFGDDGDEDADDDDDDDDENDDEDEDEDEDTEEDEDEDDDDDDKDNSSRISSDKNTTPSMKLSLAHSQKR